MDDVTNGRDLNANAFITSLFLFMFLDTVVVGQLQENSYVIACEDTKKAVIIDPGAEGGRVYDVVTSHGFTLTHILLTHGHLDHIGGIAEILRNVHVPILMHKDDLYLLEGIEHDPLQAYLQIEIPPMPERFVEDGDHIAVGSISFQVIHTPGHTPGGLCFLTDSHVFVGDTVFANSIGRTDLPGGNHHQLVQSIRDKLLSLSDYARLYPGHGPTTTVGDERRSNPFL